MKVTLTFELKEKEVVLTIEEANMLYVKLKELFEKENVIITYPTYPYPATQPWWWEKIWYQPDSTGSTWKPKDYVTISNDGYLSIEDGLLNSSVKLSSTELNVIKSYTSI